MITALVVILSLWAACWIISITCYVCGQEQLAKEWVETPAILAFIFISFTLLVVETLSVKPPPAEKVEVRNEIK